MYTNTDHDCWIQFYICKQEKQQIIAKKVLQYFFLTKFINTANNHAYL